MAVMITVPRGERLAGAIVHLLIALHAGGARAWHRTGSGRHHTACGPPNLLAGSKYGQHAVHLLSRDRMQGLCRFGACVPIARAYTPVSQSRPSAHEQGGGLPETQRSET